MNTIIIDKDGYTANSYIEIGEDNGNLRRLLDGGVVREAVDADRDRLATRDRVGYQGSGACWGSGVYVLGQADALYVMADGFNLGHLTLAIRRMVDQADAAKRADLFARIDGSRCPHCGR